MTARDYSLSALRKLRESEESKAKAEFAHAIDLHAQREREKKGCQERVAAHEAATKAELDARARETASGQVLQQRSLWQARRRHELVALHKELTTCDDALALAARDLDRARAALNEARVATQSVEKHYDAWVASEKARSEAREDDEVADRANARSASNLP